MKWIEQQVSLFETDRDNVGRPRSIRGVLMTEGPYFIEEILELRKLDPNDKDYDTKAKRIKSTVPAWSPAALLTNRIKKEWAVKQYTGLMQLDFDYKSIRDYDLEELMKCVFDLPFIALCSKSISGRGFYALAAISEPLRLKDYCIHCHEIFAGYSIPVDTTKGKNYNDIRYVSWDSHMMIRHDPEPLKIKRFYEKPKPQKTERVFSSTWQNDFIDRQIEHIRTAVKGQRWGTVQRVAFTLGGTEYPDSVLDQIKTAIEGNSEFAGEWEKYQLCAEVCFKDGRDKPLKPTSTHLKLTR